MLFFFYSLNVFYYLRALYCFWKFYTSITFRNICCWGLVLVLGFNIFILLSWAGPFHAEFNGGLLVIPITHYLKNLNHITMHPTIHHDWMFKLDEAILMTVVLESWYHLRGSSQYTFNEHDVLLIEWPHSLGALQMRMYDRFRYGSECRPV